MYNHKRVATLINEQSLMGLDEESRSPIPFQQQDDSIEYDEAYIAQLKAELSGAEERKRKDQLQRYLDAIKNVTLGDEDEGIITTNSLSEIF
ncbi:hypothetical protein BJV82DRAFT_102283 [Fennellomyces sp. T-0311]|nr:hypothetical protein BJV82DRAFT_102283 [Fennellomyces sp. T-0311]